MSDRRGVVVHLNEADPGAQAAVLRNVANLRQELGGDDPIEIVTHGGGVDLCSGRTGLGDQVAALQNRGVAVLACQNTMTSRGLTEPRPAGRGGRGDLRRSASGPPSARRLGLPAPLIWRAHPTSCGTARTRMVMPVAASRTTTMVVKARSLTHRERRRAVPANRPTKVIRAITDPNQSR